MKRIEVKYYCRGEVSHSYKETWAITQLFCPHCGSKAVWEDQGGGDYYVGSEFLCIQCGTSLCAHEIPSPDPNGEQTKQRMELLAGEVQ